MAGTGYRRRRKAETLNRWRRLHAPPEGAANARAALSAHDRGVVIVPYALSDPTWPTRMGASLTRVDNQRDACHILPASAIQRYVSDTSELGGAQRLAVFAVDFGRQRPGAFAEPDVAPLCGREREARQRPILQGSIGHEERRRIAAVMEQRGVTVRGGKRPATPPPPTGGRRRRLQSTVWHLIVHSHFRNLDLPGPMM